ncbi:LpxI family protein [Pseudooctadecabacter sp.]|uniref:LpxI family protein n=1 Tax=Pseudooctadecabacter sp. TaxID=1966338 RepID=UPI0025EDD381|nr:UDP-2,3-diacylglucosamine diphosphatase LpxI [Pseudooctadecabacter sp.]
MTIALIAGTGGVPPVVARALIDQGRVPVICEMMGYPSEVEGDLLRVPFRLETLGTLLDRLTALNVSEVCMVGAVRRPTVDPTAIDAATAPLVPQLTEAMAKGDDGTLRAIISLFEARGFTVVGAHQIAPALMPSAGVLTKVMPPDLTVDLAIATTTLAEMGQADLGQAMIVNNGQIIAREDARGTDALLSDFCPDPARDTTATDPFSAVLDGAAGLVAGAADWLSGRDHDDPHSPAVGGFLFKGPKPGQSLLADMPTIGPSTSERAVRAGLAGLVVQEGGVMILDQARVVDILDRHGLYLWVTP